MADLLVGAVTGPLEKFGPDLKRGHGFSLQNFIITRDALKGHTVSKNGSISFFFFFFVVATNVYINLFIKLSPLLLGVYCSDCLQQKQANQNPFLSLTSRGRGPTHPYLCDVNASFDLFIKNRLNLAPYC